MAETGKASAGSETRTASAEVQADFEALRRDISKLTDAVARLMSESAEDAKARVRARTQQTAEAAQQAAGAASEKITEYVEENPTTALLVAFGLGFLVGSFVRRS